jgi:hypothetical protein
MDQRTQLLIGDIFMALPQLKDDPQFNIIAPPSKYYNCIAWACCLDDVWMCPDPDDVQYDADVTHYWPTNAPRNDDIVTVQNIFQQRGYESCDSYYHERGFQKIALYVECGTEFCSHASRELADVNSGYTPWSSKLGDSVLIQHSSPLELQGPFYGKIHCYMKRAIP